MNKKQKKPNLVKEVKERLAYDGKKVGGNKTWLIALTFAILGAGVGVASSIVVPLMNNKHTSNTFLHSYQELDDYLYTHRVSASGNYENVFDQRTDFIKFAKKNFSEQFYINTVLSTLIARKQYIPNAFDETNAVATEWKISITDSTHFSIGESIKYSDGAAVSLYVALTIADNSLGVVVYDETSEVTLNISQILYNDDLYLLRSESERPMALRNLPISGEDRFISYDYNDIRMARRPSVLSLFNVSRYDFIDVNWRYSDELAMHIYSLIGTTELINLNLSRSDDLAEFKTLVYEAQIGDVVAGRDLDLWILGKLFEAMEYVKDTMYALEIPPNAITFSNFPRYQDIPDEPDGAYHAIIKMTGEEPYLYGTMAINISFD